MNLLLRPLAIFLATLFAANLLAEEPVQWRFKPGDHPFASMRSIPFSGEKKVPRCGPTETTLIVRELKSDGSWNWECFELPTLKPLGTLAQPENWDWKLSALGSRYACSLVDYELITVDLTTGKELPRVQVRTRFKPYILFDKAVWFESGELLSLPKLATVTNHPLATNVLPFEEREHVLLNEFGPPMHVWQRDLKKIIVNGMPFGETLRPEPVYYGSFSFRGLRPSDAENGFYRGAIVAKFDSTFGLLALKHRDSAEIVATPNKQPIEQGPVNFLPFRGGFFSLAPNAIHVIRSKAELALEELIEDMDAHPVMFPPLLSFDGARHPIQWESKAAPNSLQFMAAFNVGCELKESHEVWWNRPEEYLRQQSNQIEITNRLRKLSGAPLSASIDEQIKSYKAKNQWWISAYSSKTQLQFAGIPIEMPCIVQYGQQGRKFPMSVILDIPENWIRQSYIQPPRPQQPDTEGSKQALAYLSALAKQEKVESPNATVKIPEPPHLPPLPPLLQNSSVTHFTWVTPNHRAQLFLIPIGILLFFFSMTIWTHIFNALGRPVQLAGTGPVAAALASAGIVLFNLASNWLLDLLTAEIAEEPIILLIRASMKFVLQTAYSIWVFRLAVVGSIIDRVLIYILMFITTIISLVVFAVVLVLGGVL